MIRLISDKVMPQKEFSHRRRTLLAKMAPSSAAIIFSAPEVIRNANTKYPYRQNSNFLYLTGFNEPESALVLIKNNEKHNYSVLFNRVRNLISEIWFGRSVGQDAATDLLGIDRALPFNDINKQLYLLFNGLVTIYHAKGEYDYADLIVDNALHKLKKSNAKKIQVPIIQSDWRPWLHDMRLFKSSEELLIIQRAAEISTLAHTRAMKKCRPGMFEYQLAAEIQYEFTRLGAESSSYNTIVGSGKNGCILHYNDNKCVMRDGDLVLIDAGCEYKGYASDITRTFPVNGIFNKAQSEVYNIVKTVQLHALKLFKPGTNIGKVNEEVIHIMITRLVELGIMRGNVEQLFDEQAYRKFYMHSLSHWIGLDVHDVGFYGDMNYNRMLEPGMVLTVEPGLYIAEDADVPQEYHGIGIRIEDNIVITSNGNKNLTDGVPKDAGIIEDLMVMTR